MDTGKMKMIAEEANRAAMKKQQEVEAMFVELRYPPHHGLVETARRNAKREVYEKHEVAVPAELRKLQYTAIVRV